MSEARKTLTIRDEAQRDGATPAYGRGKGWGISLSRLDNLHEDARQMRRNPTEAEKLLWSRLNGQQLGGFKFSRKRIVGSTIVDFACPARWLVVDLKGDNPTVDALRDKKLTDVGIRVLRFTDEEVMQNIEAVLQTVLSELQKPFDRKRAAAQQGAVRSRSHPDPQEG